MNEFEVLNRIRNPRRFRPGPYASSRAAESKALGAMLDIAPSAAMLDTYGEDGGDYTPVRPSGPEPVDPGESEGALKVSPSAVRAAIEEGLSGLSDNERTLVTVAAVGLGAWLLLRHSKKERRRRR